MRTNWKIVVAILIAANSSLAFAKPPTITLDCGKVSGIKSEAVRQYLDKASGGGDMYTVDIAYIGKKPTAKQLDAALRECIAVAIKKDGGKDILANAWYRVKAGANPYDDDQLNPYGSLKYISYSAVSKKTEVHSIQLQKKK